MLLGGLYHVIYVLATREGRQLVDDMFPGEKRPRRCVGCGAVFDGVESEQAEEWADLVTRKKWSTGRWSGGRLSWVSPG